MLYTPQTISELLSQVLAKKQQSQVEKCMKALGHRASLNGLGRTLAVATTLNSQFYHLEERFPKAAPILDAIRQSSAVQSFISTSPEFLNASKTAERYDAAPFCIEISRASFTCEDLSRYPAIADLLAFLWLLNTAVTAQNTTQVSISLSRLLERSINFVSNLSITIEDYPDIVSASSPSKSIELDDWLRRSIELLIVNPAININKEEAIEGFKDSVDLLSRLPSIGTVNSNFETFDDAPEPTPTRSTQRGATLSERERLQSHRNAIQSEEAKAISKTLRSIVERERPVERGIIEHYHPLYFEAVIVALALGTGRTVAAAINFPLGENKPENISFVLLAGFESRYYFPYWNRKISTKATIRLPLPELLQCLARSPLRFNSARTISDCLPYSIVPWEQRCLNFLETITNSTQAKADRQIRDALARALYSETSSTALLEWLASPIDKLKLYKDSQSHYLDPLSNRVHTAYSEACRSLFRKYGSQKYVQERVGTWGVGFDEQIKIVAHFKNQLAQSEAAESSIERHNVIARFVLLALIVATGHRKSTTPFYYPWDILQAEGLAFVSDKQTVGSEARFVPIPSWLVDLFKAYLIHLQEFSKELRPCHPILAAKIDCIFHEPAQDSFDPIPSFGTFFIVDQNYSATTIPTRHLETYYQASSNLGVGEFRKTIANHFWKKGLSGFQIDAFLGHNREMHCFGAASAWSISDWAASIRSHQEAYLSAGDWDTFKIPELSKLGKTPLLPAPSFTHRSSSGYEQRGTDSTYLLNLARRTIRDLLPEEWFLHEGAKITQDDLDNLVLEAKCRLSNECDRQKLPQAMHELITNLRKFHGRNLSGYIHSLPRIEPGPIDISSSRYFCIATHFRNWWIAYLGSAANKVDEDTLIRVSEIGISMIVFDAILDKVTLKALLGSILNRDISNLSGGVLIRSKIETSTRAYTKSVVLTPITSLQVCGISDHSYSEISLEAVFRMIDRIIRSSPLSSTLSSSSLISIFKSWWLPRLTGTGFSIATRNHSGPGPDYLSELSLYGIKPENDDPDLLSASENSKFTPSDCHSSEAHRLLNNLFGKARGLFEKKAQSKREQRKRLTKLLNNSEDLIQLRQLADQQQVVSAILGIVQHLVEHGGKRVEILAFGSINTYYSYFGHLLAIFWDKSFDEIESEEYDSAYKQIINDLPQSQYPLYIFHNYIQDTFQAPPSSLISSIRRSISHCRGSIITANQIDNAWEATRDIANDGQLIHHTKTFISIGYHYGLRQKEILGLHANNDISEANEMSIRIKHNIVRNLKTPYHSFRVIKPLPVKEKFQKHLRQATSLSAAVLPRTEN